MTKLKSHWVIRAAAMIRERTSLGWRRREVGLVKGVSRNFLQLLKEEGGEEGEGGDQTYSTFCTQHKRYRSPSERIKHNKQIDADDGEDAVTGQWSAWNGGVESTVGAEIKHCERLAQSADYERPFAT